MNAPRIGSIVGAAVAGLALSLGAPDPSVAADAPAAPPTAPPDARTQAPLELTGYWVSLVTEDWRFRMLVADPGDTESVPLNPEGIKVAKAWDPLKAKADTDNACRAFGAAGLMRIPGRVHISWQDGNTLRVETDAGTQTRLFHFGGSAPADAAPAWQGYSVAGWEGLAPRRRAAAQQFAAAGAAADSSGKEGYLQVVTTQLKAGYLRTNGVPYSAGTHLLEYYDTIKEANGDEYLVITTIVEDPTYLTQPFVTSSHFKRQADMSGWDPTPCRADEPR
jgi:hypothetical protein